VLDALWPKNTKGLACIGKLGQATGGQEGELLEVGRGYGHVYTHQ
jgi:hypothetical protein